MLPEVLEGRLQLLLCLCGTAQRSFKIICYIWQTNVVLLGDLGAGNVEAR